MFQRVTVVLALSIAVVFGSSLRAQNSEQDSLRKVLQNQESDTNRVNTLLRLAWILRAENPRESMTVSEEAKRLSENLQFDKGKAMSLSTIGVLHYRRGDLAAATNAHLQALSIRKQIGDDNGVARSCINLGNIYTDQGNVPLALEHYLQAKELLEGGGDDERLGSVYLNICGAFLLMNDNVQAAKYCDLTARIAKKIGGPLLEAQALNNKGVCFEQLGNEDSAMAYYSQSYSVAESQSEKAMMVDAAVNIGNMFRLGKQLDKAVATHTDAEQIAIEMGYVDGLRDLYKQLALDFQLMGDYKSAYEYHVLFKQFGDSIYNEENSIKMVEIHSRYEQEKQEVEQRKKEMMLEQVSDATSKKRFWLIGGIMTLVVFVGAVATVVLMAMGRKKDRLIVSALEEQINYLRSKK